MRGGLSQFVFIYFLPTKSKVCYTDMKCGENKQFFFMYVV